MTSPRRTLAAGAATLLVTLAVSGCGAGIVGGGVDSTRGPDLHPTGARDEVALTITLASAWPNIHVGRAPSFPKLVVYGDGTFYADVYDDERSTLRTGLLDEDDLEDLLDDAAALPTDGYGEPGLDGSVTTVALDLGSGLSSPREVDVWVPTEIDAYDGQARDNRVAFNDVVDDAMSLAASGELWETEQWLLLSEENTPYPDDPTPPAWPVTGVDPRGAPVTADARAADLGCQLLSASDADRVRAAQDTEDDGVHGWRYARSVYDVVLIPALPDITCSEISPYEYAVP